MICATCAVEYDGDALPQVCPICADERQWVPADGQHWQDLDALRAAGQHLVWAEAEPGRVEITAEPKVGIGQTAQLVHTPGGSLLWDSLEFDRVVGNFGNAIESGAAAAVQRSARRYVEWVRGDHDDDT